MGNEVERTVLADGTTRMATPSATSLLKRLRPGHFLFAVFGVEDANVRTMKIEEYEREIAVVGSLTLYGDMRGAARVSTVEQEAWSAFRAKHPSRPGRVVILVESKLIEMAISVAGMLAGGGKVRTVSDERAFIDEIARDVPGFTSLPEAFRTARKAG